MPEHLRQSGNPITKNELIQISEKEACIPGQITLADFNKEAQLPYGLEIVHIFQAMNEFLTFLREVNGFLNGKGIVTII